MHDLAVPWKAHLFALTLLLLALTIRLEAYDDVLGGVAAGMLIWQALVLIVPHLSQPLILALLMLLFLLSLSQIGNEGDGGDDGTNTQVWASFVEALIQPRNKQDRRDQPPGGEHGGRDDDR